MKTFRVHRPQRQRRWLWLIRHCACGVPAWPCWDNPPALRAAPPPGRWAWNGPTRLLPKVSEVPLLTRGAQWRTRDRRESEPRW